MFHGCHSPDSGRVCSPVVEVETLRVRFNKGPLCLSVCSVPKEVSAEASDAHVVTVNLCRYPQFCPEAAQGRIPFPTVFIPDLVLGWHQSLEHGAYRNQGSFAVAWDLGCLSVRAFPGLVCPRSISKLQCEVGGTRVFPPGKEPLHTPPQGLSTGLVQICDAVDDPVYMPTKSTGVGLTLGPPLCPKSVSADDGLRCQPCPSHVRANKVCYRRSRALL